jgi:Icc-related predicted phosphoesterase
MKIAVCSDLHLEFGGISLDNKDNVDVLVLSGDICIAKEVRIRDDYGLMGKNDNNKYHTYFQECCDRFPHVIYIMGNHEHYHGDYATSLDNLRTHLAYLKNLYILDKQVVTIDDVTFVAGTLWTDMNREDPVTLASIRGYMNDYKIIANSNHPDVIFKGGEMNEAGQFVADPWGTHTRPAKFTPEDSVVDHKAMLEVIDTACKALPNGKIVVCGHHSPSKLSTKPQYENDVLVNGAYSSDLSEFILDRPQIKLWTHGHTHHVFDYMIGSTRIFCNPRGYINYEDRADQFELLFAEV